MGVHSNEPLFLLKGIDMRLILTVAVPVCFTFMLLSGCSKDKDVVAPTDFSAMPPDSAKNNKVSSPKLPPPHGNK